MTPTMVCLSLKRSLFEAPASTSCWNEKLLPLLSTAAAEGGSSEMVQFRSFSFLPLASQRDLNKGTLLKTQIDK